MSEDNPEQQMAEPGCHRTCYSKFTKKQRSLAQLEQAAISMSGSSEPTDRIPWRSSGGTLLFARDYIFCNKLSINHKKIHGRTISKKKKKTVFDMGGGKSIQKVAEERGDEKLLNRIRGKCLFSVEAHCHPSMPETVHAVR